MQFAPTTNRNGKMDCLNDGWMDGCICKGRKFSAPTILLLYNLNKIPEPKIPDISGILHL